MGFIATNKNQVTFIYNSNNSIGKQALAYIAASNKELLSIDTAKTKVTSSQWVEIAQNLNLNIAELIENKHPNFLKLYSEDVVLKTNDWLKVIEHNPEVVIYPILINGTDFFQIKTPSDVVEQLDIDSANISRNPTQD